MGDDPARRFFRHVQNIAFSHAYFPSISVAPTFHVNVAATPDEIRRDYCKGWGDRVQELLDQQKEGLGPRTWVTAKATDCDKIVTYTEYVRILPHAKQAEESP